MSRPVQLLAPSSWLSIHLTTCTHIHLKHVNNVSFMELSSWGRVPQEHPQRQPSCVRAVGSGRDLPSTSHSYLGSSGSHHHLSAVLEAMGTGRRWWHPGIMGCMVRSGEAGYHGSKQGSMSYARTWINAVCEKHRASTENKTPSVNMFMQQWGVLLLFFFIVYEYNRSCCVTCLLKLWYFVIY